MSSRWNRANKAVAQWQRYLDDPMSDWCWAAPALCIFLFPYVVVHIYIWFAAFLFDRPPPSLIEGTD